MSVTVENLSKKYGSQVAVDNISFTVNTGEVVGFLGPNGAGKSTTMKMITCFIAPASGDVRLDRFSISKDAEEIKKRIGYLPENNPLYTDMPVIEYLQFCAEVQGMKKDKISPRMHEMIEKCGLDSEKHKKINELSKGFRQRVGLAQAMIHDPEVLILDEPTSGLDPNQIVEIRNLIKELGKEKTVILSSHILSEVEATCDRIIIINNGRIVADGTSLSLRQQAQGQELLNIEIEAEADYDNVLEALTGLASVETANKRNDQPGKFRIQSKPEKSSRKAVFDLCVINKWYLTEMTAIETKLEDVFRELTN